MDVNDELVGFEVVMVTNVLMVEGLEFREVREVFWNRRTFSGELLVSKGLMFRGLVLWNFGSSHLVEEVLYSCGCGVK